MRWLAGAGLFALVGCNQIFGLSATQAFDAAPDGVLDRPHVTLDWQIGTITAGSKVTAAATQAPTFAPITPAPKVRIAPLAGALADAVYAGDGTIEIPREYITQAWRLEYTLDDRIPHEVQWQPDDKVGHLTVPIFGRVDRTAMPQGAGYAITVNDGPGSFVGPRVFTIGLWTEGTADPAAASPINFDFANARSLSGILGKPDPGTDRALVIDYTLAKDSCRVANGAADFDPTVQGGASTTPSGEWDTKPFMIQGADVAQIFSDRLSSTSTNGLTSYLQSASKLMYGAGVSQAMPGLTVSAPDVLTTLYGACLPVPVMVTLLECPLSGIPANQTPSRPAYVANLPSFLHVQLVGIRMALGVNLVSGLETVLQATNDTVTMGFPAPLAKTIELTPDGKAAIALDGTDEQVTIGPATGTFTLSFVPETDPKMKMILSADYYDVVLHTIAGGGITTQQIFTVPAPASGPVNVQIDGKVFAPNTDYVFEIRSYTGHPQAAHGDFSVVAYPYGSAILYSRTFRVSP